MTPERFRVWLPWIRIAHHLRGRIRLKLESAAVATTGGYSITQLPEMLQQLKGIRSISVNWAARSCTVEYDPEQIPMQAWSDWLAGSNTPAAGVLDNLVREACRSVV